MQPRWKSSTQSAKSRPGADYGSDNELFIAKFGLKLNKVWKTTRLFEQIAYLYRLKAVIKRKTTVTRPNL